MKILVKVVNVLGSTAVVIVVSMIATGTLAWRRRWVLAGLVMVASGSAATLVHIVKVVEPRSRPDATAAAVHATARYIRRRVSTVTTSARTSSTTVACVACPEGNAGSVSCTS